MAARKVSQEEYDKLRSKYEEQYDYEHMSDENKAKFDEAFDSTVTVDDKKDADDSDQEDAQEADQELERSDMGKGGRDDDDDEEIR